MTALSPTPGSRDPKPPVRPAAPQLLSNAEAAAAELRGRAGSLADADVRAPSRLPGWSRGHVLAHVAGVADAMARQLEYAARGETVELYDGGADGRNRAIEEGAVRSADRQRQVLDAALDRALSAFGNLGDEDWDAPIAYRGGVVRDGGLALWRELVIHATDLGTGAEADSWSPQFCEHLFDFLSARIPAGMRVRLQPFGMAARVLTGQGDGHAAASGSTVSVNGMATDIAAWLAGRTPNLGSLRAEAAADGVDLPKLLPWPAGIPAN